VRKSRPVLIIAHPGHELLLRHWLVQAEPSVFALSDGSGSTGRDRRAYSKRFIEDCGARTGPVFGPHSDRELYSFLQQHDTGAFLEICARISEAALLEGCDQIVCDAVEHYNPMHDIANIIAHVVRGTIAAHTGSSPDMLTSDIRGSRHPRQARLKVTAASGDIERKLEAAQAYFPLENEFTQYRDKLARAEELFFADNGYDWPETLPVQAFYERFGADRVANGTYRELITYRDHVRPLALDMLQLESQA
jgi:hypothetical protein